MHFIHNLLRPILFLDLQPSEHSITAGLDAQNLKSFHPYTVIFAAKTSPLPVSTSSGGQEHQAGCSRMIKENFITQIFASDLSLSARLRNGLDRRKYAYLVK
uniref:(northern house mosquito) hypothetical protein n=1 Tax=Culex pipiens TaxID=7175 RepID=A0A8D8NM88_CULPI